jgi:hypothetical protein
MKLSPELSLLVKASLRGSEDLSLFSETLSGINQEALNELSSWHQVRSLLFDYLNTGDASEFDVTSFKSHSISEAVYNMIFLKKSIELDVDLENNGVHAFLMKGAFWAWWLYENPALREFGDIDFFFQREHITRGLSILESHGFVPDSYRKYLLSDTNVAKLYFDTDYQLPLTPVADDMVASIEVQWNATYPRFAYSFTWDELMLKNMAFNVSGGQITVPSVENQLLMMLVHHAGVEQWDKLKYMADFVRLLRKFSPEIDWEYVIEVTKEKGFYRLLLESVGMVQLLTGEDYMHFCAAGTGKIYPSDSFRDDIISHWENRRPQPVTKSWRIFYYNMIYRDRLSDKISILFKHLAYLVEWRLLIPKARWYYGKP